MFTRPSNSTYPIEDEAAPVYIAGMRHVPLQDIVRACDQWLSPSQFKDYDGAVNGLQVENRGGVSKIVATVDASFTTVQKAIAAGADLLLVHHGLFWSPSHPWTGRRYELLRQLIEHNLAVYSQHLPLDAHPTLGNCARLARALGARTLKPFFHDKGQSIGWRFETRIQRTALQERLAKVLNGPVTLLPGGPEICRHIGVCTGGAGSQVKLAATEGVDAFITGEGPHWTHALSEDLGVNVYYGGHYATETFGVKALAERLSRKFRVPWEFLDHPSGL
jgi:dinuclear metal center YbgI/SA1388 family protein